MSINDNKKIIYFKNKITSLVEKGNIEEAVLAFHKFKSTSTNVHDHDKLEVELTKLNNLEFQKELMINGVGATGKSVEEHEINPNIKSSIKRKNQQELITVLERLKKERNYKQIINISEYAIKNNCKSALIHYFLGVAYNVEGDFENAKKHHYQSLNIDPNLADIRLQEAKFQGTYEERLVECIGCGETKHNIVWAGNQSIAYSNNNLINPIRIYVKCEQCGLIYANPQPKEHVLNKYYSVVAKEKFGGAYGNVLDTFEFQIKMSNERLSKIENYSNGKTLLDIGAGAGFFVGTGIDRGWQAKGLELTNVDCEYAKYYFDLDLEKRNFYDFSSEETYDVVTLFEVIEHLQHPLEDLKKNKSNCK